MLTDFHIFLKISCDKKHVGTLRQEILCTFSTCSICDPDGTIDSYLIMIDSYLIMVAVSLTVTLFIACCTRTSTKQTIY